MDYKELKSLLEAGWLFRKDKPFQRDEYITLINPNTNETLEIEWQLYHKSRMRKHTGPMELPNDDRHYYGIKHSFYGRNNS